MLMGSAPGTVQGEKWKIVCGIFNGDNCHPSCKYLEGKPDDSGKLCHLIEKENPQPEDCPQFSSFNNRR